MKPKNLAIGIVCILCAVGVYYYFLTAHRNVYVPSTETGKEICEICVDRDMNEFPCNCYKEDNISWSVLLLLFLIIFLFFWFIGVWKILTGIYENLSD